MNRDQIVEAVRAYIDSLQQLAGDMAPDFDADDIRRFRVETKRLRALLHLLSSVGEQQPFRLGKRFKQLYRASGEIRDAQMQLIRVVKDEGPSLPGYALWLASRIGRGQHDWLELYSDKVLHKLEKRVAAADWPESIDADALRLFVDSQMVAVNTILKRPQLHDEDLDDIRKKVKDLQHILNWARTEWTEGMAMLEILGVKEIGRLAQRAGDYNDEQNAIATLSMFISEKVSNKERADAEEVRRRWTEVQTQNRSALLRDMDAFRNAAA